MKICDIKPEMFQRAARVEKDVREVFDRIDKPTLTGKLVYPITDKFIVQWEEMLEVYPKAINFGSIF